MCSTPEERIAEIERAIDQLAADAAAYYGHRRQPPHRAQPETAEPASTEPASTEPATADQIDTRLAELWALLADLDPEMAAKIPRYRI